jgi:DNA modification methylase
MLWNSTHCGDNLIELKRLKDEGVTFDLVLTDPPYNVGKDFGNDTDKLSDRDFLAGIETRLELASSLLADNGSMLCFASHRYVARVQLLLEKHLKYQRMMIWHYRNGMSRQTTTPVTEYEPFLWMVKDPQIFVYNADDVRVPYRSDRVRNSVYKTNKQGNKVAWNPDPRGAKRGDVWEYPCLAGALYANERTEHPTQKPLSLTTDLLRAFLPKNSNGKYSGTVLDPYIGSGTTAVGCEILNRMGHDIKWYGIELEQKWIDVTTTRVTKTYSLFDDKEL